MKRYITIDLHQMHQHNLTLQQWALCENIHFMCNNASGYCYASKDTLAAIIGISKRTVFRLLSELETAGFLEKITNKSKLKTTDKWLQILSLNSAKVALSPIKIVPLLHDNSAKPAREIVPNRHAKIENEESKKREARAIDFLKQNDPISFEAFEMQNKKQINNYDKFCLDFNDTVDQEQLKYITTVLFARLGKYARNWIANNHNFTVIKNDNIKPTYLKGFAV